MRVGAGRLEDCVKDDMGELGLNSEWVVFRDMWRSLRYGQPDQKNLISNIRIIFVEMK